MSRRDSSTAARRARRARAALATATALIVSLVAADRSMAIEFDRLGATVSDASGPVRQAGAHPDVSFRFSVPTVEIPHLPGMVAAVEQPHRLRLDLPLGLVGDPTAAETCEETRLKSAQNGTAPNCPVGAQVGTALVHESTVGGGHSAPVYNVERPAGSPGMFAFVSFGAVIKLTPTVRAGDYGITIDSGTISQGLGAMYGAEVTLWGVPADPVHDAHRVVVVGETLSTGASSQSPRRPFLTLPTSCPGVPETTTAHLDGWDSIGRYATGSFSSDFDGLPFITTGCERLAFEAATRVEATSSRADSPTGLTVDLSVPQNDSPDGLATAHVRRVAVTLPNGMSVSPSSAAGLGACAPSQIRLGSDARPSCPPSSTLGSVEIVTPLLDEPMRGQVLLARQNDNPFGSLLALYIVAEGSGVMVKLPGRVDANPVTGQLVATFDNNPQLPFSDLRVRFDGGPQAALATPAACGTYTTHAEVSSWSGKVVGSDSPMVIDQGCDTGGFAPGFSAGSRVPIGGASSPFTLSFSRNDGEQLLSAVDATLPQGLLASIASVPLCAEAQAAAGTCGESSRVGHTNVLAGPGPAPLSVPEAGKAPTGVFLAGPYKGAPFSLSILVPAQAGPFDLGNVVVRAALHVDRDDAHVTVKSDPIPSIVQGIPLRIRQVTVHVDRPRFMVNPTNCKPKQVLGQIQSLLGASAKVSSRFQVGNCAALPFAPRMRFTVGARGRTARELRTPLVVSLGMSPGQANNRSVEVTLPKALNARLDVVKRDTACSIAQFNADACPNPVGTATAVTPLLGDPLRGPVYFVYNPARRLPDLVARLKGQVDVDLVGNVTIARDLRLKTTFATIPDVPIATFRMALASGDRNGPIGITRDLCRKATRRGLKAAIAYRAQSDKKVTVSQKIEVAGCGKAGAGGKAGARGRGGARGRAGARGKSRVGR